MKRISIILFMVLATYSYTFAQQPAICGDWIGVYEVGEFSDEVNSEGEHDVVMRAYKRTIRIKQIEGHYTIRMKSQRADGKGSVSYMANEQILTADDHRITWMYNQGYGENNRHYFMYCAVDLVNGVLKYSEYWISEYPGGGRKRWGEISNQSLFKDEEDW